MIDWARGYEATWRVMRVDPGTWGDAEELAGVVSASVERDASGSTPLMETGSITVDAPAGATVEGGWYRMEMLARQAGETERHAIATLLVEATEAEPGRAHTLVTCAGRSVLAPAAELRMPLGSYVPAGSDAAAWAARCLRRATPAPVDVEGGATLADSLVIDPGASYLDAALAALAPIGWRLRLSGDGRIRIARRQDAPTLALDARLVSPAVRVALDLADVPNRVIVVDGEAVAEAVDDDPARPTSVRARGRYVDRVETSPTLVAGESLDACAARLLAEATEVAAEVSYEREWMPDVAVGDVVRASLAEIGVVGPLRVSRQSLACGAGVVVSETCGVIT